MPSQEGAERAQTAEEFTASRAVEHGRLEWDTPPSTAAGGTDRAAAGAWRPVAGCRARPDDRRSALRAPVPTSGVAALGQKAEFATIEGKLHDNETRASAAACGGPPRGCRLFRWNSASARCSVAPSGLAGRTAAWSASMICNPSWRAQPGTCAPHTPAPAGAVVEGGRAAEPIPTQHPPPRDAARFPVGDTTMTRNPRRTSRQRQLAAAEPKPEVVPATPTLWWMRDIYDDELTTSDTPLSAASSPRVVGAFRSRRVTIHSIKGR